MEFHQHDDSDVSLMEMRFYVPPNNDGTDVDPVKVSGLWYAQLHYTVDESQRLCRKFECRKDIHYKTQTRTSCQKCNSKAFRLGIEPVSSGLLD